METLMLMSRQSNKDEFNDYTGKDPTEISDARELDQLN
jgi:hypothetical protein